MQNIQANTKNGCYRTIISFRLVSTCFKSTLLIIWVNFVFITVLSKSDWFIGRIHREQSRRSHIVLHICSTCCTAADSWSRYMMCKGGWLTCRNNGFSGAFLMVLEPCLWWLAQVLHSQAWSHIRLGRGVIEGHTMWPLVGVPWGNGSSMPELLGHSFKWNEAHRHCLHFHVQRWYKLLSNF